MLDRLRLAGHERSQPWNVGEVSGSSPLVGSILIERSETEADIRKVMQRLCDSCFLAQLSVHNSVDRCSQTSFEKEIPMIKQPLLILAAAGLISIAPFATAQDNPSNSQASSPAQNGRWHGHEDPAQRTAELTKKLKLTSDQQTKVQDALQSEHSQMESLHQDSSLSQQDRRAKMMEIRKSTDGQIRGLLDADQQKKWDEMQAQREQRMQNRHGDAGSGAPPQQ
jgi:periplasmic protein CpxP/Spy